MNPIAPSQTLLGFLQFLKAEGFTFGIGESRDILSALKASDCLDRNNVAHTIRTLTCRSREDWRGYDLAFRKYWFPKEVEMYELDLVERIDPRNRNTQRMSGLAGASKESPRQDNDTSVDGIGAGTARNISKADFRFINDKQAMRHAERIAERMANQLKRQLGRRRTFKPKGNQIDIRRTIRKSLSTGGLPLAATYSVRKPVHPHLVVIHDVSHSMSWNNPLLFRFARGLVRAFDHSHAFAFHTKLFSVTSIYREQSLSRMKERLEENNKLWMGGTKIAESLKTFNDLHSRLVVTPKTVVIIISDGFDTEDREKLRDELDTLAAKSRSILWLNPMLGREGVTTTAEQLKNELPEVDVFLPANSLEGLQNTVKKITALTSI
ncbi:MAG: VWA domain-containing protein [Acidiferrobacterales bacterium]|nr:VWA domain-containing protein [Acidiferrobacterales bacterium]